MLNAWLKPALQATGIQADGKRAPAHFPSGLTRQNTPIPRSLHELSPDAAGKMTDSHGCRIRERASGPGGPPGDQHLHAGRPKRSSPPHATAWGSLPETSSARLEKNSLFTSVCFAYPVEKDAVRTSHPSERPPPEGALAFPDLIDAVLPVPGPPALEEITRDRPHGGPSQRGPSGPTRRLHAGDHQTVPRSRRHGSPESSPTKRSIWTSSKGRYTPSSERTAPGRAP